MMFQSRDVFDVVASRCRLAKRMNAGDAVAEAFLANSLINMTTMLPELSIFWHPVGGDLSLLSASDLPPYSGTLEEQETKYARDFVLGYATGKFGDWAPPPEILSDTFDKFASLDAAFLSGGHQDSLNCFVYAWDAFENKFVDWLELVPFAVTRQKVFGVDDIEAKLMKFFAPDKGFRMPLENWGLRKEILRAKELLSKSGVILNETPNFSKLLSSFFGKSFERIASYATNDIRSAVLRGKNDLVKTLCEENHSIAFLHDEFGWNLLHYALAASRNDLVDFLVSLGVSYKHAEIDFRDFSVSRLQMDNVLISNMDVNMLSAGCSMALPSRRRQFV